MTKKVDHVNLINVRHNLINALSYCEAQCHNPYMKAVYHLILVALKMVEALPHSQVEMRKTDART